ncbi:ADP-ribosyl-[dinitrogen reductase] glycohydrolase [termite gut metagenome]|uniref:ADP-ribosyl-[dinitrogen reductase] glycohydrolase n=1 Tax=termite gut metagenome TaxID=433724 RepID=A0A5J4RUI1_9ZZZZ
MLGAIAGDIIGSCFEFNNTKRTDFELFTDKNTFTDDTVCTIAIADALLKNGGKDFQTLLVDWCRRYPRRGYGGLFYKWFTNKTQNPYHSFGNGSAIRVSPVAWFGSSIEEVLRLAGQSAAITHNHPEGIKGAKAIAHALFLARTGRDKDTIKKEITTSYAGYYLNKTVDEIRENNVFDATCQVTVPQALSCFLESDGFENCIRLSISIGGDSDTIACMAGAVAEAYYGGVPQNIKDMAMDLLPNEMKEVITRFYELTKQVII